ncbi:MAG TPA: M48 family metallopeptidase [Anaeromyxobacter sp.]|nr:M48 family metallopeptidase [Anaeromyxobacter sp.]
MEPVVVPVFLAFFVAQVGIETALLLVNLRHVAGARGVPPALGGVVKAETAERSRAYTLANGRFALVEGLTGAGLTVIVLLSGVLPWADAVLVRGGLEGAHRFVVFLAALALVSSLVWLPFGLWRTFALEARFGFNRTTPRTWLGDRAKSLLVQLGLGVPLLYATYGFMRFTGRLWWVWLFVFLSGFQLFMLWLYPAVIAPLFNRFEPLPEGPLRERLEALARDAGFRNRGLFVMDASRRSGHSNAYFTGIFRPRIVLFDTLVERMSVDEAASVLAHEIGHYKARHVHRRLGVALASTLLGLLVLSWLVPWPPLHHAFGFPAPTLHGAIALFALGGGAFVFWLQPLASLLSRRHEYEADRFAVRIARAPAALKSALVRLNGENLSNLHPHPWYSGWHYSHPALVERLAAIDREAAAAPPAPAG